MICINVLLLLLYDSTGHKKEIILEKALVYLSISHMYMHVHMCAHAHVRVCVVVHDTE